MLTTSQNRQLNRIMNDQPQSIRDLALMAHASRLSHPDIHKWRCVLPPKTPCLWTNHNMVDLKPFVFPQFVPTANYFLWHVGDCYYIGLGDGPGLCTTPFKDLLVQSPDPEALCLECLRQIALVLNHLNEKHIFYVHGNLTVDFVARSTDGRFYIIDNGFPKIPSAIDPYACYSSRHHDLHTLCNSISNYVATTSVLRAVLHNGRIQFQPDVFMKHLDDDILVFKRSRCN